METESRHPDHLDPQAQLTELQRLENAVAAEAWMPQTPVWHAPLLAMAIAGLIYSTEGSGIGRPLGLLVAVGLAIFGLWDTMRRRTAKPKRLGKPLRIFAFYLVLTVVSWSIVVGFNAAIQATTQRWPEQLGPLLLAMFIGFVISSILFAVGIEVTNRWRNRWVGINR